MAVFSEVYKGIYRDESGLPRDVAIKVIRGLSPTESNKAAMLKRLNRETMLWHTLKHPNVLEFLGVVRNMGSFFALVSPYCAKGYVTGYLDDNPQSDRLDLVSTVPQLTYRVLIICLDPWCSERCRVSPRQRRDTRGHQRFKRSNCR